MQNKTATLLDNRQQTTDNRQQTDTFAQKVIKVLTRKFSRVRYGQDTFGEFVLFFVDQTCRVILRKNPHFYSRRKVKKFSPLIKSDCYQIKDARIPLLDEENQNVFFAYVFEDTFYSYLYLDDSYSEEDVDKCDIFLYEGLYGLVNDKVNVTVQSGDVVIDAGSWIGDFAAYASAKGAGKIYAFEPLEPAFSYLKKTAELNANIIPVQLGISNKTTNEVIFIDACNTGSSSFMKSMCVSEKGTSQVETVTIDEFVRANNIERVDFIKSDIEGYERYMLEGAQETLRRFSPKLALCTYHLPDDPEVMSSLILKANPKYNIVHKSKKLYASVPE